jgi:spore coat protein CotH
MNKKRLYQVSFLLLAGLLVLPLFTGLTGCDGQTSAQAKDDSAPFYSDRVVTVRFVMPENDWEYMQENALQEQYTQADMWYDGTLVEAVALRPKGNSSLTTTVSRGSIRFSFKADLNFFNSARNLDGVKKLNFNNGFSDPTFMRETLAYDIFQQMGIPTPRNSFVDLWINDSHMGLYTMVEQVDATFLSNHFSDGTGNLYKPEMPAAALKWTEADYEKQLERAGTGATTGEDDITEINLGGGLLSEIMSALGQAEDEDSADSLQRPQGPNMPRIQRNNGNLTEQMGLKTNEDKPNYSALFRFLEVLNNEPLETFPGEIEKVLDVDQVLRFLAVSTAVVHLDNYTGNFGHNYYLYEVNGKFTVIPWDLNMAFGTHNAGLDRDGIINFFIDEPTAVPPDERPLVSRLLAVPEYLETYHRYLYDLLDGPFSPDVINVKIQEIADMIRPYVEADTLKFYSTHEFEINLRENIEPRRQVPGMQLSIGLIPFVRERGDSIRQQLEGELPSTNNGKGNEGTMPIPGMQNRRINIPRRSN